MFIDRSQSVYVGNLGPVPLYLHWSFLILLWLIWPGSGLGMQGIVIWFMVILAGIILHELGHALAARAQGMTGVTITMWALGGLCSSRGDTLPVRQIIILVAGPAVSLLLYLACMLGANYIEATHPQWLSSDSGGANLIYLTLKIGQFVNWMLFIFNILPIFPLDGGQIVYNTALLMTRESTARRLSLVVAVLGACAYVGWQAYLAGGHFPTYSAVFMAFLLFNAYNYLR